MSRTSMIALIVALLVVIGVTVYAVNRNEANQTVDTDEDITADIDPETSPVVTPSGENTPTAAATPTASPETVTQTVSYDGSSFSPNTITIKAGETVTFVNNSRRQMWVASDPHPVHTNFSAFDARRGYAAGESYSFTFTKADSYDFHDHLNDNATGTITVN